MSFWVFRLLWILNAKAYCSELAMSEYFVVTIAHTGESFRCSSEQSLLRGMENLGRRGIPVGCREGGCGICKIQVLSGSYVKRIMSRDHVSGEDALAGRVLACRIRPGSDLVVKVIGKLHKAATAPRTDAGAAAT